MKMMMVMMVRGVGNLSSTATAGFGSSTANQTLNTMGGGSGRNTPVMGQTGRAGWGQNSASK